MPSKIKLKDKTYYWVKTITMYRGRGEEISENEEIIVGYYEKYSDNSPGEGYWNLTGSDEVYYTYTTKEKMDHRETCVIPIEEIKNT